MTGQEHPFQTHKSGPHESLSQSPVPAEPAAGQAVGEKAGRGEGWRAQLSPQVGTGAGQHC